MKSIKATRLRTIFPKQESEISNLISVSRALVTKYFLLTTIRFHIRYGKRRLLMWEYVNECHQIFWIIAMNVPTFLSVHCQTVHPMESGNPPPIVICDNEEVLRDFMRLFPVSVLALTFLIVRFGTSAALWKKKSVGSVVQAVSAWTKPLHQ